MTKESIEAPTPWLFARSPGTRWVAMESFKTADDAVAKEDASVRDAEAANTGVEYQLRYLDHEADLFARRQLDAVNALLAKTTPVHPG